MAEAVDLPDGAALLNHIRRTSMIPGTSGLWAKPYGGVDPRNGWDTYMVLAEDWGPVGFMDGPVPELCGERPEWATRYCEPTRT